MCNNHGNGHHNDHTDTTGDVKSIKVLFEPYREEGMNEALHKELALIRALPESDNDQVIERLEKLVTEYSTVPSLYSSLAYMYEMQKDFDKAESMFKKAVTLFPENIIARTAYAGFFLRRGTFDAAAALFDNIFDIRARYPDRPTFYALEVLEFYGTLGLYYIAVGKSAEAHNALAIVKRIDPQSAYARNIGDMLGVPREDDPNFTNFFKLLKKERSKVRLVTK